ncbi:VOC family protein [Solicola sp. PLA-1-18]|uniref:VOC family protein n=1 Tax=Solicola sp. PLA-1-18 TaxID=3380532 RepID=UPI003B7ABD81
MPESTKPAALIGQIHHVRVSVTDLARSRAFYEGVLGFEPAIDSDADETDPAVRERPDVFFGGVVYAVGGNLFGLRPIEPGSTSFDPTRVGLDHASFQVGSRDDLVTVAGQLDEAGVEHGEIIDMPDAGMSILSFQDPDDINLELIATA